MPDTLTVDADAEEDNGQDKDEQCLFAECMLLSTDVGISYIGQDQTHRKRP